MGVDRGRKTGSKAEAKAESESVRSEVFHGYQDCSIQVRWEDEYAVFEADDGDISILFEELAEAVHEEEDRRLEAGKRT